MFEPLEVMARKTRSGRRSARRLVDECLAAIAAQDGRLHAFVATFPDRARSAADRADRAAAAGIDLGPLHGIPFAVKDLADVEGHAPSFGSLCYGRPVAPKTAPAIARLEAAGAVLLGTTHLVEFANGSWGTNHAMGTPMNPADAQRRRVPGGSSSGSAVAVAAGLVPFAIGSDTGGSIRIPASLCGVVGYKPTYGRVPLEGIAPLGPSFDTLGPLTTRVEDAALVAAVMCGEAARPPRPRVPSVLATLTRDALLPLGEDVDGAWCGVHARLAAEGIALRTRSLPRSLADYQRINGRIVAHEIYRHVGALAEDPALPLDPHVRARVLAGREIDADEHAALLSVRAAETAAIGGFFEGVEALLLPTTPLTARLLEEVDEREIPMSRLTRFANYLDLCAISIPLAGGSLPVGLQLVAPRHRDADLLDLAAGLAALVAA